MGNVMDTKGAAAEKPVAVVQPMQVQAQQEPKDQEEEDACPKTSVMFHLFHYRQQLALKQNHVVKWATSKLLLTEELLKQQQHEPQEQEQQEPHQEFDFELNLPLPELDADAVWAESQLSLLTDDDDDNSENLSPIEPATLHTELSHLIKYRLQLRNTIYQVAQEKVRKREKTKLKRLKRRTLISSKKPSNKDKHRY